MSIGRYTIILVMILLTGCARIRPVSHLYYVDQTLETSADWHHTLLAEFVKAKDDADRTRLGEIKGTVVLAQ